MSHPVTCGETALAHASTLLANAKYQARLFRFQIPPLIGVFLNFQGSHNRRQSKEIRLYTLLLSFSGYYLGSFVFISAGQGM